MIPEDVKSVVKSLSRRAGITFEEALRLIVWYGVFKLQEINDFWRRQWL